MTLPRRRKLVYEGAAGLHYCRIKNMAPWHLTLGPKLPINSLCIAALNGLSSTVQHFLSLSNLITVISCDNHPINCRKNAETVGKYLVSSRKGLCGQSPKHFVPVRVVGTLRFAILELCSPTYFYVSLILNIRVIVSTNYRRHVPDKCRTAWGIKYHERYRKNSARKGFASVSQISMRSFERKRPSDHYFPGFTAASGPTEPLSKLIMAAGCPPWRGRDENTPR